MVRLLRKIPDLLKYWLVLAVAIILLSFLAYFLIQQSIRQGAYDPQIQIAEDAASAFASGKDPKVISSSEPIDISKSLAPFIIVFDNSGKVIVSSVKLDDKTPTPPAEVFDYTKKNQEDRFTWQPKPEVRVAAIIHYFKGTAEGYVLVGRSLREAERQTQRLLYIVLLGSGLTLVSTLITALFLSKISAKDK